MGFSFNSWGSSGKEKLGNNLSKVIQLTSGRHLLWVYKLWLTIHVGHKDE